MQVEEEKNLFPNFFPIQQEYHCQTHLRQRNRLNYKLFWRIYNFLSKKQQKKHQKVSFKIKKIISR